MSEGKCPVNHGEKRQRGIEEWWPDRLDLRILRQNSEKSNPMDNDFDYAIEFNISHF